MSGRGSVSAMARHEPQPPRPKESAPHLASGTMPAITPRAWLDDARALLDALGDAVVVVGDDGLVAFVNEAASVLLGWSASEATGRACDEVLPLRGGGGQHPLDVAKLLPRGAK